MHPGKTTNPDLQIDLDSKSKCKRAKVQPNFSLVVQKLNEVVCRMNDAPDETALIVMDKSHIPLRFITLYLSKCDFF